MVTKLVLAAWGSGALAVTAAGVIAAAQLSPDASAAPISDTTSSAASGSSHGQGKASRPPTPGPPAPPAKALVVTAVPSADVPSGSTALIRPIGPGVNGTLTVRVENPNNQAVRLTGITGDVSEVTQGTSGPTACDKDWFVISPLTGTPVLIEKKSHEDFELDVTFTNLPSTNQDRCKGAQYSFTFTATADQA